MGVEGLCFLEEPFLSSGHLQSLWNKLLCGLKKGVHIRSLSALLFQKATSSKPVLG